MRAHYDVTSELLVLLQDGVPIGVVSGVMSLTSFLVQLIFTTRNPLILIATLLRQKKIMLAEKKRAINPWQASTDRGAATKIQALYRGHRQVGVV